MMKDQLETELDAIKSKIRALATENQNDSTQLLPMLRVLESLHREIRDDMFLKSLPNTRRGLYQLLKDIEEMGGWPYIERMRLENFLVNLQENKEE
jgi:hypothetical protein